MKRHRTKWFLSAATVALTVLLPVSQAAETPQQLFERRIMPIFKSTPARWHSVQLDGFGDLKMGMMRRSKS